MNIEGINNNPLNNNLKNVREKATDDSFEKRLREAAASRDKEQLRKVCKEFEGIFLNMMYRQMKAAVQRSDLIPADAGRDIYESMLDESLMDEASKGRSIGLADMLYKQMSRNLTQDNKSDESGAAGIEGKK